MAFTFLKPSSRDYVDTPKKSIKKTGASIISQIKFDKDFLEKLLSKLTIGNGRSIHLNAIPGRNHTRLDLFDLSVGEGNKNNTLANNFLEDLLTKPKFKFSISWDEKSQTKMSEDEKSKLFDVSKKLDNIVADNEDMYLETGLKNFGFGYPLLVKPDKKDPKKIIIAPIFIWSLDIDKSNRRNEWFISKTEDSPIKVNELLVSHIENDEKVVLPKLTNDELDDSVLSEDEIIAYVNKLNKGLGIKEAITNISLQKCPENKEKVEKITSGTPWIQWSGVFGLFRSQKEPIIEATRELLDNVDEFNSEELIIEPFQTSTTTSFEVDPSQREIIDTLNSDEFKIIQGPPGTGKSQAISAIISNALANGAKTLVVCEKKTALDVLVKNLESKKLDCFCAVVDDVVKDRRSIVEKARRIYDGDGYSRNLYGFDEGVFEQKYNQFIELRDSVNASYKESSKPIFAGKNWKDLVGEYLRYSKNPEFESTKEDFGNLKLKFTEDALNDYLNIIKRGALLFSYIKDTDCSCFKYIDFDDFEDVINIKQKKEIEKKLNDSISSIEDFNAYVKKSDFECNDVSITSNTKYIEEKIAYLESIEPIYKDAKKLYKDELTPNEIESLNTLFAAFNEKAESLDVKIDFDDTATEKTQLLSNVLESISLIKEKYKQGNDLLGENFDIGKFGIFNRLFSKNVSEAYDILINIKKLVASIHSNISQYNKYQELDNQLEKWKEYTDLKTLLKDASALEKKVKSQQSKIYKNLGESYQALVDNSLSFSEDKNKYKNIIDCKKRIDSVKHDIVKLFPLTNDDLQQFSDIKECKLMFNEVLSSLSDLRDNMDKIEDYNTWVKFENTNQNLMDILETIDVDDWEDAFLASYYYYMLLDFESKTTTRFHKNDTNLNLLKNLYNDLEKQNLKRTFSMWDRRIQNAMTRLDDKYGFKALFALKKNQKFGKRLSLKQIIDKDFASFTTIFPVILVNPIVANTLFKLEQGSFDLVIFDEASQLRIEDVYTAMIRGKYKIIAGDQHQMPPSNYFQAGLDGNNDGNADGNTDGNVRTAAQLNAESLLVFAESLKYKNMSYLDFHYRSKHPALINFSNAAFYGGNLCPLPVVGKDYRPIEIREVNGVYSSGKASNINPKEAVEVISILNEIKPNPDGTMPSVGIATFNIHQRNCIKALLYETSYNDEAFKDKFEKLQQSGLFVKNLENIQGDEKDIIIISTTFGPDESGKFYQRFGSILTDNGYKLLNVLITRAKSKLYVVTSVPKSAYSTYKELLDKSHENNKAAIFYAYIAYAKAVSDGDKETVSDILSQLCKYSYDRQRISATTIVEDSPQATADGLTESVFEEEVYNELLKFIDKKHIHLQYPVGGYRLDFMLEVNGHKVALECDGKAYHNTDQAYAADMHRQKWIENHFGFEFYRIWSTNWFEEKDKEVMKLKRFIESLK
ncbi:MAG: AAA domain-containing protein [Alphaproteobacteria bacterium]|nr:AAA domain-containing protein [Alphaproteobacteria bacterium]